MTSEAGMPQWAGVLIQEIRASNRQAQKDRKVWRTQWEKDRKQAAEDRKQAALDRYQAAQDRKQADQDRKAWIKRWEEDRREAAQDRKEAAADRLAMWKMFQSINQSLKELIRGQRYQTKLLELNTLLLRRIVSNGRMGGNGRQPSESRRTRSH